MGRPRFLLAVAAGSRRVLCRPHLAGKILQTVPLPGPVRPVGGRRPGDLPVRGTHGAAPQTLPAASLFLSGRFEPAYRLGQSPGIKSAPPVAAVRRAFFIRRGILRKDAGVQIVKSDKGERTRTRRIPKVPGSLQYVPSTEPGNDMRPSRIIREAVFYSLFILFSTLF